MKKIKLIRPTAAENRAINAGIAADPDTYELTDEQFKTLRPLRGRPKSETHKVHVTVRLDPEVVQFFRAPGRGWQTRMNSALVAYIARRQRRETEGK
jgi:uncharacterized protein (DUF4415 family)